MILDIIYYIQYNPIILDMKSQSSLIYIQSYLQLPSLKKITANAP